MKKTVVCLLLVCSFFLSNTGISNGAVGKTLPDLIVKTLDGETVNLTDNIKENNKPAVLNFTTTWCFDCKKLSEQFKMLIPDFKPKGVDFYYIYIGQKKRPVENAMGICPIESMPVLLLDLKRKASKKLDITSVPHLVIVNPEGVVSFDGFTRDKKQLLEILQSLVPESIEE